LCCAVVEPSAWNIFTLLYFTFLCLWPPLSNVIFKSSADPYRVSKCKKSKRKYLPDCTHKTEFLNSFIYYSNLGFIHNEIGKPEGEDGSSSKSWTVLKKSAQVIFFFLSWIVTRVSCFRCTAYPGSQYHKWIMIGDAGKGYTFLRGIYCTIGAHCTFPAFSPNIITIGWRTQILAN
jgi:hypothetical protein